MNIDYILRCCKPDETTRWQLEQLKALGFTSVAYNTDCEKISAVWLAELFAVLRTHNLVPAPGTQEKPGGVAV